MIWIDQKIVLSAYDDAWHDQNTAARLAKPFGTEFAGAGTRGIIPIGYLIAGHYFIGRALGNCYLDTVLAGWEYPVEVNELLKHGEAEVLSGVDRILAFLMPAAFRQLCTFAAKYRIPALAVPNTIDSSLLRQLPVCH